MFDTEGQFQSPLHRGTSSSDFGKRHGWLDGGLFQSPLHRGTGHRAGRACRGRSRGGQLVSIPSQSGHIATSFCPAPFNVCRHVSVSIPSSSGHGIASSNNRSSRIRTSWFQSPLHRGTSVIATVLCFHKHSPCVSIPSSSGHIGHPAAPQGRSTLDQLNTRFNPLFIGAHRRDEIRMSGVESTHCVFQSPLHRGTSSRPQVPHGQLREARRFNPLFIGAHRSSSNQKLPGLFAVWL